MSVGTHLNSLIYIAHLSLSHQNPRKSLQNHPLYRLPPSPSLVKNRATNLSIQCSENQGPILRTCKNCKTQFDPVLNHPRACRYHTAHFGGETKRKFESVFTGGTMDTPDSGKVFQYWHCCGSEDPFDPGCTSAPHSSYDD
ncbi:uncharacterized protein LOC111382817 [Olea europaea var. sylvestris]|uniref:uncharacterized protein LOC111382817 n=1 Tax=Olea europaea var. sylvestris TaxID=158386 RepID=UPI000C1CEACA|nr:uncharacterized protein LOC111382817 [Olea europaea var. sylvestris]